MNAELKTQITQALDAIIAQLAPTATTRPMYGGTVIEFVAGNPKSRVGGYFVYDAHVSVEFTHGAELEDPDKVLMGKGKARRHVKLLGLDDLAAKDVSGLLSQAVMRLQGQLV